MPEVLSPDDEPGTGEPPMRPMPAAFLAHRWKPGFCPNPHGAKPGMRHGRGAALALLDEILGETDVKVKMKAALRAYILQRPVAAFKSLVMPLLPKDVRVDVASQRVVVWRSFMEDVGMKPMEGVEVEPTRLIPSTQDAVSEDAKPNNPSYGGA